MAPVLGNAPWGGKRPAGSCPPLCDRENTKLGLKYYTSQVFFHISMYLFYRSRAIDFVNAFPPRNYRGVGTGKAAVTSLT